jgi:uncharacterized protein
LQRTDKKSEKLASLQRELAALEKVLIAFSAGVDSTLLLKVAQQVLGKNIAAVTVELEAFPEVELESAVEFCKQQGIKHYILTCNELEIAEYRQNPPERCYICKKYIFSQIKDAAAKLGFQHIAEGSNLDDLQDYRPGIRALEELGIHSPFVKAGLTKADVRALAKDLGLAVWDKPSMACLASRFPYGEEITKEKLTMVNKAERILAELGFKQFRVRYHGDIARIEILKEEQLKILEAEVADYIYRAFAELGFSYTTLDLKGYRSGSLNEKLLVT